ncbi:WD domain repeat-containing protein 55 [Halocaridina rubra]|uniref:WD repeat-containing protein 55 homolog n=1 Tax=Halocaridina rubra TaxID=373956 RepID=A0AAN8XFI1_HALRR
MEYNIHEEERKKKNIRETDKKAVPSCKQSHLQRNIFPRAVGEAAMKMRSFIPNIEDPPESDDSDDEIPPGGVFPFESIQGESSDTEEDASEAESSDNNEQEAEESEADISVSGDSDTDSYASSVPDTTIEEVFGIKPNIETQRDHPPDIKCDSSVVDVCFHPEIELLSAATLDGEIVIYRYNRESTEEVTRFSHHDKACRAVCYSVDGKVLYSVSKDKSLAVVDTQNSSLITHIKDAHEASIHSFAPIDSNICATGDDDGTVKLWDLRKKKSIFNFKCGEQTVYGLLGDKKYLAASLCDGSLAGFNIRAKRLEAQSEMYNSELTSMALVRDNSRLVVGSGDGCMYIFNWGEFGFHIDRFAGHPGQINCSIPIGDRMLITGCEDGNIRAVHMYAHRYVGVVGQHKRFGVENMSVSFDADFLVSCAMDDVIRFWNINYLYDVEVDGTIKGHKRHDVGYNLESSKRRNRSDFFSDIPEQMESDDEGGPVAGPSHTAD